MDYDDLYKSTTENALKSAMINAIQGDGTGNYVKNLLSPTIVVCQYCGETITGTDYEKALHINGCINKKMSEELVSAHNQREVRESLLKELKKLL